MSTKPAAAHRAEYAAAADYADRILRGADPASLPVQTPTRLNLVLNARTARESNLGVPEAILASADEIID